MKDSTIGKNNYTDILGKRSIFFRLSTTHTIQCTVRNYYIVYHYEDFSHKIYKWIRPIHVSHSAVIYLYNYISAVNFVKIRN